MSTARQFGRGTLSRVVTGRTKLTKSSSLSAYHCRFAKGFGQRDGTMRNYLSAEYRDRLSPVVTRRRRHGSVLVYNQSASGYGVDSADVEESFELEEGGVANGSAHETFDAIGVPVEKRSHPTNVKRELAMLTLSTIGVLTIDLFAQLMETAFIGRIGSIELGSAGVATIVFNNISKLLNIPLLSVSTSFVAEDIAKHAAVDSTAAEEGHTNGSITGKVVKRKQLASVSTALLLAIGIGIFEATALSLGCGPFLGLMGVTPGTPMRIPAERFLSVKALGAPAVAMSLALHGIFRGFKDTKTPLFCMGIGNLSLVFLFPLLLYQLKLGVTGAALATVLSQFLATLLMLWNLNKKVVLLPPRIADLQLGVFMKSGGFLIGSTLAVLTTMTLATAMAARQGTMAMAGHQICMQVWLAVSLLTDAVGMSAQTMVASYSSKRDYVNAREVTNLALKVGLFTGLSLAAILGLSFGSIAKFFTADAELLQVVNTGALFVCASQPLNALAYIFDGLHFGVSDFPYAACSMMTVGAICSVFLLYVHRILGLHGVWSGLALFMALRTGAGIARLMQKSGPWWFLHKDLQSYHIACNSEDSQLQLANGTYAFTAHNCVQFNCDASNN